MFPALNMSLLRIAADCHDDSHLGYLRDALPDGQHRGSEEFRGNDARHDLPLALSWQYVGTQLQFNFQLRREYRLALVVRE